MNALMIFCAFMATVYVPVDFLWKPVARDEEAWLGFLLRGWAAKATEPLHWLVYAAGAYGFWRMRPWMWPWAAAYSAQLTIGMLVWNIVYLGGVRGWLLGLVCLLPFGALTAALWNARPRFTRVRSSLGERYGGGWAVVTGASSGIGAEFARALAREGFSCVLAARREDRLRELASELETRYGISTCVVAVDLAEVDGTDRLAQAVEDLDLAVLVNNAGFGYVGRFEKQEPERLRAMLQVNCVAPVMLTRRLLPAIRKRARGAIVFTGSIAGRQPIPLHGVYAATKAFDLLFGEALWGELRGSGIDVVVLEPGSTATEFQEAAGELPHDRVHPQEVVAAALDALGRQPSVVPGWLNWARTIAIRGLPRPVAALVAAGVVEKRTPLEMR
jgi:hypothetical protein